MSNSIIRGGMTRRGLLQGAAAGSLLIGAGMRPAFADDAPRRGGKMRVAKGHGSTSDSLDPGTWENNFMRALGFTCYNRLTEVLPDGSLAPDVAEDWEPTPDARTWSFKIRKANFQDGSPIRASDVAASINHHRGEDSQSAAKPLVEAIENVEVKGNDIVVFTLQEGNADFPFIVSDYHLPIGKADDEGRIDWEKAIGSGSYVLENFEPGVRADFTRWDGHWREDRGWFDEIELLAIIDPVARQNAMMTGAVDAIDRVDVQTIDLLERNPNLRIISLEGTQHFTFPMQVNADPFTDPNVRNAVKYAVKRQEMVDKILGGYGVIGNDLPIGRNQMFYNNELPQREYDADKAKWYLKEAGLDSLDITLHAADVAFAGAVDAAQLFAASAKDANINIKVERAAEDAYWSKIWMVKPFCAAYFSGRPVIDQMFSMGYECNASWNDTSWCNERFDELLLQARAELDEEKRREMYFEMQEILHDEDGLIAPMFASYVNAIAANIGHGEMASNWDMDGERWAERWWFNS